MKLLENLNDEQKQIVLNNEGSLMVLAGAGSGKTKAITSKIIYLLEEKNISPLEILAVTFTNKAAKEMKERVLNQTPINEWHLNISTFHSFCVKVLRQNIEYLGLSKNFTIYDTNESKAVIKKILKDHEIDPQDASPKDVLNYIDMLKNKGYYPDRKMDLSGITIDHDFYQFYMEYERELFKSNAIDFGSLITKVLELFEKNPKVLQSYQEQFKYFLVDEYQDTNKSQFDLINLLAKHHLHLCVVGDLDQSIYSFRNAEVRNILNFESIYPNTKILKLEKNYRSTKTIVEAASQVISNNKQRKEKRLISQQEQGEKIKIIECLDQNIESELVANNIKMSQNRNEDLDNIAVFYRNNAQSRKIEEALRKNKIPYKIIGGMKFYDRKEVKDLIGYLKILENPQDNNTLIRIINTPSRGIGATTVNKLIDRANELNTPLLEYLFKGIDIKLSKKINNSLNDFTTMILNSRKILKEENISECYDHILKESGYLDKLESSKNYEDMARIENLKELKSALIEYNDRVNPLQEFLEESSLASSESESDPHQQGYVQLMTIHASKGLEFDKVFITGVEENLFPSSRSLENTDELTGIEEERRLFYVAMTRAKHELYITYTESRMMYGSISNNRPSRFLSEIPSEYTIFTTKRWN